MAPAREVKKKHAALMELLRQVPLFADLDDDVRERVLDTARQVRLRAGEWLFRERDAGKALYLVIRGRLEVISEARGTPRLIAILGVGECVGELALLSELPRSASIRARRDCELLEVKSETFTTLMTQDPRLAVAMTHVLATRLHRASTNAGQIQRGRMRVLAVLPLHQGLPVDEVRDTLTAYFGGYDTTIALDGSEIDVSGRTAERTEVAYARLLDRAEGQHETVLLFAPADDTESPWARFCMRQGDRHLLLARTNGPVERARGYSGRVDQPELALFGPLGARGGVRPWLDAVNPAHHHLVFDTNRRSHLDRLARRLAGRSVGVVLSGGGARGFAHVGVLEALQRHGVVIDRVGGTSIGALMAGLFAMGLSTGEMQRICLYELQSPFDDYTLPLLSLTRARKALKILDRLFGDTLIEELPIDLFCMSADLLTAQPFIHRDGELADAIACSAALPGLTPPRRFRKRLLVDGALLNNLPTDIMAASAEGPVIASDVMVKHEGDDATAPHGLPPGVRPPPRWLQALGGYLGNQRGPLPTIVQTLMRASVLGAVNAANTQRALADLVIMPRVSDIGLLDFARGADLFEAGRDAVNVAAEHHGLLVRD